MYLVLFNSTKSKYWKNINHRLFIVNQFIPENYIELLIK